MHILHNISHSSFQVAPKNQGQQQHRERVKAWFAYVLSLYTSRAYISCITHLTHLLKWLQKIRLLSPCSNHY
ncbi:hypothetical protein BVC80_8581g7 [Macleaya cordata]|uniref:Uncharacterized protein n=1 Tax=Macleaya cordata TaxID=56857 RepID=A0A200RAM4_MACCD|nr:hypothetical protein BVC80_8581g7 [Macleaya cordata]